jgi:hypothetical protein
MPLYQLLGGASRMAIQEYVPHGDRTNEVFQQSFRFTGGYLHPGKSPDSGWTSISTRPVDSLTWPRIYRWRG